MEEIRDWGEWIQAAGEDRPYLVDQLLPEDAGEYMLISGRTGIGKSVLVTYMALCLASGQPFYTFPCQKVVVGFKAMEGGRNNIRDRLIKVSEQYPDVETGYFKFQLSEPAPLETNLEEYKRIFDGCRVVIFDNLRQLTTGNYLKPDYAAEWIRLYQSFLRDIGAVGILTHHIKKPNMAGLFEPGDIYQLKGATEYSDAATTVLLLERKRQGHRPGGSFARVETNKLMLYFAKTRIATYDLSIPIELVRNYDSCSLDMVREE